MSFAKQVQLRLSGFRIAYKNLALAISIFGFSELCSGQTNPAAQALPYTQNFSSLAHTSATYPSGLQGWNLSASGSSATYRITDAIADFALLASATATSNSAGVKNYNGKIGFLSSNTSDASICLAINTTGLGNISVGYEIMTIRNPHDGVTNTRINEVSLQYRVGTSGNFTTLTSLAYQNNTTTQTTAVTTPQNQQSRSVTLPSACNDQSVVQLRWTQIDVSGGGARPSFAVDDIAISGSAIATYTTIQDGNWNSSSTWDLGSVPTSAAEVNILHEVVLNSPLTNTGNITISSSGKLELDAVLTDNGLTSVDGVLAFESGGAIAGSSPVYGTGSTLLYTGSGIFSRGLEWSSISGAGYPYNVQISNNTTLDLGANGGAGTSKQIAGNLTIDNGSILSMNINVMTKELSVLGSIDIDGSLVLSTGIGANLNIGGSWTLGVGGSFTPNGKKVTFNGSSGTQYVTGNTTFYDLTLSNTGATTDFGATTITITNAFSKTNGTMLPGTSTFIFSGNPGSIAGSAAKFFYNIQVNNGADISHTAGTMHIYHDFTNNGTFTQGNSLITYFDYPNATETLSGTPVSTTFGNIVVGLTTPATTSALDAGNHIFTVSGNTFTLNEGSVFDGNTSTVSFTANCTVSGNGTAPAANFYNATISAAVDFSTISTIYGTLQINSGGSVSNNAPTYATNSLLKYNTGNSAPPYDRWLEWNSGSGQGYPYNVQVSGNTTLRPARDDQSYSFTTFSVANNLTIDAGSEIYMDYGGDNMNIPLIVGNDLTISGELSLSGVSPGDIKVGGDWNFTVGGAFYPNARAVFFIGSTQQNITRSAAGTISFDYVINDNSSAGGIQLSTGTSIYISAVSGGNGLQLLDTGPFDLNGQTCTLGNGSFGSIQVTGGVRNMTSTGGAAIFVIEGSSVPTPVVYSSDGTSTLVFSSAIRVELNSGFDFGDKLTTINGTLRMNNSSFVKDNAPTYGTGSLLQYYTNSNPFNRTVEWGATSGPGYPYNVQLSNFTKLSPGGSNNSDTALNLENNLTIDAGSALYMNYGGNNMTQPLVVGNNLVLNGDLSLSDAFNGDVKVGGNWTRNSTTSNFYPNERAAFFTGSSATPQSVTVAPSGTETFDYLIIDNSGAGVSLSSTDVHVDDLLTLSNGIVTTGSNEIYIMNNAGNAITGYQTDPAAGAAYLNSSYISGRLRRDVVAGSNYVFPVGTATSYQYDSISLTTFSGASNILCFYTAGNFSGATQCSDPATQSPAVTVLGTPITNLLLGGYWTMTPDVTPSAAIYDISLQESAPFLGVATDDSSYAIIKRPDCIADWIDEGFHDDVTQQSYPNVTTPDVVKAFRSSVTSFSDFGIGYNSFFLLPVELTHFTVSITEGIGVLEWSTASEYNSHYFSIESSEDAIHFKEIGRMNAAGFSTVTQHYLYNDVSAGTSGAARIYYRLRMVDTDNSFQYSAVRWVDLNESTVNESLNIFPNPVQDLLSVTLYSSTEQSATIELTEVTGKLIRKENRPLQQGNNFLEIDRLDELADGIYLLKITAGRNFYSGKVVKE